MRTLVFFTLLTIINLSFGQNSKADSLLQASFEKSKSVGMVAGYASRGEQWVSSVGYADLAQKEPMSIDTRVRIASVSKTITAVAIMQLMERRELELDHRISKYLEKMPAHYSEITIRQLLNHSSGIRAYKSSKERENKREYASLEAASAIFSEDLLEAPAGTTFSYSTYGYVLLGMLIEEVSGVSYEEYLVNNIFRPLGMEKTGLERISTVSDAHSAVYHKNSKGKVREAERTNLSDRLPGGGIYSTVGDVLLFGHALVNNQLISESSFDLMMTDSGLKKEGNPYGLGLYLYGENPNHGNVVGHSGTQLGASAQLMLLPEVNAVTFVVSNTSRVWEDSFYLSVLYFQFVGRL